MIRERPEPSRKVTSLERIDYPFMLGHDLIEHSRRSRRPERRDTHEAAKLAEERVENRQTSTLSDLQMKLLVELEKRRR